MIDKYTGLEIVSPADRPPAPRHPQTMTMDVTVDAPGKIRITARGREVDSIDVTPLFDAPPNE